VADLRHLAETPSRARRVRTILTTVAAYLARNAPYMDYAAYLARGWPIATGVIVGACRHLVKDRCELSGLRWTIDGAASLLRLRCVHENGDWDAYHALRRQRLYAVPYPDDKEGRMNVATVDARADHGPHGAWAVTVTFPDGHADLELLSLTADGIVTETNAHPGTSIGVGVWTHTGERSFAYALREQLFDASGAYVGEVRVRAEATLDATGDTFDGRGEGVEVDPTGREIFRNPTTVRATRFSV